MYDDGSLPASERIDNCVGKRGGRRLPTGGLVGGRQTGKAPRISGKGSV